MNKKSSKMVSLVLITAALASCSKPQNEQEKQKVFMRADSSAPYTEVTEQYNRGGMGMGNALLWYMAFRPMMNGAGFMSNGIATKSNVGTNTFKENAMKSQTARGGFGSAAKASSAAT